MKLPQHDKHVSVFLCASKPMDFYRHEVNEQTGDPKGKDETYYQGKLLPLDPYILEMIKELGGKKRTI